MLQTLELFSDLSAHECEDIERIAQRMSVRRGEIIFAQGEFSRDFFVVESGQVEIQVKSAMSDVQTVAILKNGDIFGEMALFDKHSARSATARSMLNTSLFKIPGEAFEKLLKEKPGISFKLLGALSRRLKATTAQLSAPKGAPTPHECKVILVGAPRNGVGKTTCAISLGHLLSQEAEKKVLFIDLDMWFADATYFLGTYSIKSVLDMLEHVHGETMTWENLSKYIVPSGQRLFTLPGPANIVDGERLNRENLTKVLKAVRSHFDFVVVDTDCRIDEVFLTAVDMADHVYFLVDASDMYAVKSSARYFQGFGRLNFPENRMTLLLSRCFPEFDLRKSEKIFKYPVRGVLPQMENYKPEYGKTAYQLRPNDPYLGVFRRLLRDQFQVPMRGLEEKGFLARFFSSGNGEEGKGDEVATNASGKQLKGDPGVTDGNIRVLLKYIRANMVSGQLEEAKNQTLRLLNYCQDSALVFVTLGEIQIQENQYSEAVDAFRRAVDLDPQNHIALGHLALLSNDEAAFQKAHTLLQKKIEQSPNWPDLYTDLGELLLHRKNFQDAIFLFGKALSLNPRYTEARLHLGFALGETEKFEEGVRALLDNFQPTVRGYYLLGTFLYKLGRYSEAMDAYNQAAKLNPRYLDLLEKLDEIKSYLEKINNLIEMHREVMHEHPDFPDLHLKLGNLLSLIGRRAEAEKSFREALRLNPKYSEAQKELDQLLAMVDFSSSFGPNGSTSMKECRVKVCHGLKTQLTVGRLDAGMKQLLENHQLTVLNVRTLRRKQVSLTATMLEKELFDLDVDQICPVEEHDILLFEIVNPLSGAVVLRHLHLMEKLSGDACQVSVDLAAEIAGLNKGISPVVPVRYFLVNVRCKALLEAMNDSSPVKAWVSNPRLSLKAEGMVNPEISGEAHFVLASNEPVDVVQAGDSLHLEVQGANEKQKIDIEIPVQPEDIGSYRKLVGQPWTKVLTLQLREWKASLTEE